MAEHWSWEGQPPGEPIKGKTYRADGWSSMVMIVTEDEHPDLDVGEIIADLESKVGKGNSHLLGSRVVPHPTKDRFALGIMLIVSPAGRAALERDKATTVVSGKPTTH